MESHRCRLELAQRRRLLLKALAVRREGKLYKLLDSIESTETRRVTGNERKELNQVDFVHCGSERTAVEVVAYEDNQCFNDGGMTVSFEKTSDSLPSPHSKALPPPRDTGVEATPSDEGTSPRTELGVVYLGELWDPRIISPRKNLLLSCSQETYKKDGSKPLEWVQSTKANEDESSSFIHQSDRHCNMMRKLVECSSSNTTERQLADLRKQRLRRSSRTDVGRNRRLFLETRIQSKRKTTLSLGTPRRRSSNSFFDYETDDERENIALLRAVPSPIHIAAKKTNCLARNLPGVCSEKNKENGADVRQFFDDLLCDPTMPSDESFSDDCRDDCDEDGIISHSKLKETAIGNGSVTNNCQICLESDEALRDSQQERSGMASKSPTDGELELLINTSQSSSSNCVSAEAEASSEPLSLFMRQNVANVYRFYQPEAPSTLQLLLGSFTEQENDDGSKQPLQEAFSSIENVSREREKIDDLIRGKVTDDYRYSAKATDQNKTMPIQHLPLTKDNERNRQVILKALSISSGSASHPTMENKLCRTDSDSINASFEELILELQGLISDSKARSHEDSDPTKIPTRTCVHGLQKKSSLVASVSDEMSILDRTRSSSFGSTPPSEDKMAKCLSPNDAISMNVSSLDQPRRIELASQPTTVLGTSEPDSVVVAAIDSSSCTRTKQQQKRTIHGQKIAAAPGGKNDAVKETETPLVSNSKRFSFSSENGLSTGMCHNLESTSKSVQSFGGIHDVEDLERTLLSIKAVLEKADVQTKLLREWENAQYKRNTKITVVQHDRPPPTDVVLFTPKSQRGSIEVELERSFGEAKKSPPHLYSKCDLAGTSCLTESQSEYDDADESSASSSTSSSSDELSSVSEGGSVQGHTEFMTKSINTNSIVESRSGKKNKPRLSRKTTPPHAKSWSPDSAEYRPKKETKDGRSLAESGFALVHTQDRNYGEGLCPKALEIISNACRCTGPLSPRFDEREVMLHPTDHISQLV